MASGEQSGNQQYLGGDPYQKENTLVQLYWAIFETWSAQVDSYWTRTNYFVAFELAAFAGTWFVFDDNDITSAHCYILAAAVLIVLVAVIVTAAWIFNIRREASHMHGQILSVRRQVLGTVVGT